MVTQPKASTTKVYILGHSSSFERKSYMIGVFSTEELAKENLPKEGPFKYSTFIVEADLDTLIVNDGHVDYTIWSDYEEEY